MKQRSLFVILALVLVLTFTLAACGENKTGSATPDSAAAAPGAQAGTTPHADSSKAPAADTKGAPAADAKDAPAADAKDAPAADAKDAPVSGNAGNNDQQNAQGNEPADTDSKQDPGQTASSKAPAAPGKAPYNEDEKPSFTISMTNTSTKKTYSAACAYATDKENVAFASFFLPGGSYDIAVYEYTDSSEKTEPLATAAYKNDIGEKERKSIQVNYTPDNKKIEVEEKKSERNQ